MRRRIKTELFERGFRLDIVPMGTWTQYEARQVDMDGMLVAGRRFYSSRRREAEAQLEKWRYEDRQ